MRKLDAVDRRLMDNIRQQSMNDIQQLAIERRSELDVMRRQLEHLRKIRFDLEISKRELLNRTDIT